MVNALGLDGDKTKGATFKEISRDVYQKPVSQTWNYICKNRIVSIVSASFQTRMSGIEVKLRTTYKEKEKE